MKKGQPSCIVCMKSRTQKLGKNRRRFFVCASFLYFSHLQALLLQGAAGKRRET